MIYDAEEGLAAVMFPVEEVDVFAETEAGRRDRIALVRPSPDGDPADVGGDARLQHVAAQFRAGEPRQRHTQLGGQFTGQSLHLGDDMGRKAGGRPLRERFWSRCCERDTVQV